MGEKMEKNIKNIVKASSNGYLTYNDFINLSLYHPEFGYYHRKQQKIGADGDFITSSNVGDVFGRTLGRWFLYLFQKFQLNTTIIELGAGTGKTAQMILDVIKELDEELYSNLRYTLVETSSYHQTMQKQRLKGYDCVEYKKSLDDVNSFNGIIFSNEFFDAFPVHIIEKKQGQLLEAVVAVENDLFVEKYIPLRNPEILIYLHNQQLQLKEGQRIEIPLAMNRYYRQLTAKIESGLLLTIDYGYTNEEWGNPAHRSGSIRGFQRHRMVTELFKHPGEIDITAHIHWDCLRNCHNELGMETVAFMPQSEFLISAGIFEEFHETAGYDPFSLEHKRNRSIRSLIDPGQISAYFQVLVQTKNVKISRLFSPVSYKK